MQLIFLPYFHGLIILCNYFLALLEFPLGEFGLELLSLFSMGGRDKIIKICSFLQEFSRVLRPRAGLQPTLGGRNETNFFLH